MLFTNFQSHHVKNKKNFPSWLNSPELMTEQARHRTSSAVQNYDFILKSKWSFPVCMIDIFDLQVCDKHMMRVSRQVYNISVLKHFSTLQFVYILFTIEDHNH